MKVKFLFWLAAVAAMTGCSSAPKAPPPYALAAPGPLVWPWWPTNEPPATNKAEATSATNLFILPPPLLQLPEQKAMREEIQKSGIAPELLQKMLQGQLIALPEIEQLAQKGVSETNIIKYLRSTGAVYFLTSRQVSDLQQAKMGEGVIDYLLRTPSLYRDSALLYRFYYYSPLYYPGSWPWHHYDYHHGYYHPSHYPSIWGHDSHHH